MSKLGPWLVVAGIVLILALTEWTINQLAFHVRTLLVVAAVFSAVYCILEFIEDKNNNKED